MDVGLLPHFVVASHSQDQLLRERVDHGYPYTVQAARHFVAVVIELTTGVQHGHDDLGCRDAFFVSVYRNAATVVAYGDGLIGVDDNVDIGTVSREGFIDRVIDDFKDHMVEARAIVRITDIHTRTLTDCIKAFQYLNAR